MSFFHLIETLYEQLPFPCSLTSKSDHTYPLLYINSAFESLTGYNKKEILGQNCRFLNAKYRAQPNLALLRETIRTEKPILVDLVNHTKTGVTFGNRLVLLPIDFDDEAYFLGLQNQVPMEDLISYENADELGHEFLNRIAKIIALYQEQHDVEEFKKAAQETLQNMYEKLRGF